VRFTGAGITPEELAAGVVTAALTVTGALTVAGSAAITGPLTISGALTVSGTASITGSLTVGTAAGYRLRLAPSGSDGVVSIIDTGGTTFATLKGTGATVFERTVELRCTTGLGSTVGLYLGGAADAYAILGAGTTSFAVWNAGYVETNADMRVDSVAYVGRWDGSTTYAEFGHINQAGGNAYGVLAASSGQVYLSGTDTFIRTSNADRIVCGASGAIDFYTGAAVNLRIYRAGQLRAEFGSVSMELYPASGQYRCLWATSYRTAGNAQWVDAQIVIDAQSPGNVVSGIAMNCNGFAPQLYAFTLNGNTLSLRDAGNTAYTAMFGSSFTNPSSRTIKRDIRQLDRRQVLDQLRQLRAVRFRPAAELLTMDTHAVGGPVHRPHVCGIDCDAQPPDSCELKAQHDAPRFGLIAEEVAELWPELCRRDAMTGVLGIDYAALTAPLLDAVADLADQLDQLRALVLSPPSPNPRG
jgi:hypothetical protein